MKAVSKHTNVLCLCLLLAVLAFGPAVYASEPLKVFILAGQSNMEGQGKISPVETPGTLEYMFADDPVTYGHLWGDGDWAVRDDVWIWYKRLNAAEAVKGGLSAGYGVGDDCIGPELQFGHLMGDFYDGPVLIIKCAWGGKSIAIDFRPPSSGWSGTPSVPGDKGYYYQVTVDTINDFKANPSSFCEGYDPADGYEIVGFGWHQGWNDLGAFEAEYESNMVNFIKDIRSELGLPNLPFSIATTGMAGGSDGADYTQLELAQLEVGKFTKYPDFEGDVAVEDTTSCKFTTAESPSDQGFHWNHNANSYYLVGEALGEAMKELLVDADAPVIDAGADKITWTGKPVTMDPTIIERAGTGWENLTYKWTANPDTGVVISGDETPNPTVTITKSTENPSTVVLKLEVNNDGRVEHGVINTMQIDVYDTACKAAIGKGLASEHPADLDGDCIINLSDFTQLALQWFGSDLPMLPIRK